MKTISTRIRILLVSASFGALATIAHAGAGVEHWKTLGKESQFKELKPGTKVAFVCDACRTISEMPVASKDQAMGFCTDGSKVTCPNCKKVVKVVIKRERNAPPNHTEVTYVDDKGQPCAFMAIAPAKM